MAVLCQISFTAAVSNSAASLAPPAPPDGGQTCIAPLVGKAHWWTGDRSAADAQGGDDGALQGGASFAPARVGRGFVFDSDDDRVTIPNQPTLDMQPVGFTAALWLRGTKNQPQPLFTVFDKSHGFADNTGWVFQGDSATGVFYFAAGYGGGFHVANSNVDVLDGQFHHVAATWDGASLRIYVDGVLRNTQSFTAAAGNTRPLNIGFAAGDGTPHRFFRGQADELEIYTRAFKRGRVRALQRRQRGRMPLRRRRATVRQQPRRSTERRRSARRAANVGHRPGRRHAHVRGRGSAARSQHQPPRTVSSPARPTTPRRARTA